MADTIYLKTGHFSSGSFKASKNDLKRAADSLYSLDYYGAMGNAMYACNGCKYRIFTAAMVEEASSLAILIDKLQGKLDSYSKLLESGPEALREVDSNFKGEYTNAWQRGWYAISSGVSSVCVTTVGFWGSLFRRSGKKTEWKTIVDHEYDYRESLPQDSSVINQVVINGETVDYYSDAAGNKNSVQRGRIRWVYQSGNYEKNGWFSEKGSLDCYPGVQCNSASASMAMSYMGIDRSPASLVGPDDMDPASWGTCTKIWLTDNGETIQLENHALTFDLSDIKTKTEAFLNDGGKGELSPVMIRYAYPGENPSSPGANGHWLIVVGDNGDGTYQVIGPASESERITTVSIDANGNISGKGISRGGGVVQRYAQYSRIQ